MNIYLEVRQGTVINGISVGLKCTKCGNTWGVRLLADRTLPKGSDICTKCVADALSNQGMVNYGHEQKTN